MGRLQLRFGVRQFQTLMLLADEKPRREFEVDKILKTHTNFCLSALERKGYLKRNANYYYRITPNGLDIVDRIKRAKSIVPKGLFVRIYA